MCKTIGPKTLGVRMNENLDFEKVDLLLGNVRPRHSKRLVSEASALLVLSA